MRASFGLVLLLVGCADNGGQGLFILNNTAPSGESCMLTGKPDQPFFARGEIEANSQSGYLLTPLIQSRIDALPGREAQRTVHLQGANIVLSSVGSDGRLTQSAKFTSLISGSVSPLGTTNVAFEIIPAASLNVATTTEMSANITVFGTLGGGRIDGEPFDYPVTVCTGNCLSNVLGPCAGGATPAAMNKGNPCNTSPQDIVVDCCTDGSNNLVCPGPLM